jgi:hypothetical protein
MSDCYHDPIVVSTQNGGECLGEIKALILLLITEIATVYDRGLSLIEILACCSGIGLYFKLRSSASGRSFKFTKITIRKGSPKSTCNHGSHT